jgi:hypothetical protein
MSESYVEQLAGSRYRWLIVTSITLGIALATLLPQVDHYIASRSERAELEEQIARATEMAESLQEYETKVAEKSAMLTGYRNRLVDETRVTALRNWLVDAARDSGCQVRKIDIGAPDQRAWRLDDQSLDFSPNTVNEKNEGLFNLQKRRVMLSISGSSDEIRSLLKVIDADNRLAHPHTIELRPSPRQRNVQLDLILWYYALVRSNDVA